MELRAYIYIKTCTQVFIAALFLTDKKWKPAKYASAEVSEILYIYTTKYLFVNKKEWSTHVMLQYE